MLGTVALIAGCALLGAALVALTVINAILCLSAR